MRTRVSAFVLSKGARTRKAVSGVCVPISPYGDGWYRESSLVIEFASHELAGEKLEFSVLDLVKTVLAVCAAEAAMPAVLPNPRCRSTLNR